MNLNVSKTMKKWYRLNNVGKYFAFTSNINIQKVFRFSAILQKNIEEEILQQALNRTIEIYSNFNVNLKKRRFRILFRRN